MKVHVTLDWLIDVRGTDDPDEAIEIATGYMADQQAEQVAQYIAHEDDVACDPSPSPHDDEYDDEVTLTLYPDDEDVPSGEEAGAYSTYNREVQLRP